MVEMKSGVTILPEMVTFDFSVKQMNMVRHFRLPAPAREVSLVTHRNYVKQQLVDVLKESIVESLPDKIIRNKKRT